LEAFVHLKTEDSGWTTDWIFSGSGNFNENYEWSDKDGMAIVDGSACSAERSALKQNMIDGEGYQSINARIYKFKNGTCCQSIEPELMNSTRSNHGLGGKIDTWPT